MRRFVDTLWAEHRYGASYSGQRRASKGLSERIEKNSLVSNHPVVRVHPRTGERALFVNPGFVDHIVDVDFGGNIATTLSALKSAGTVAFYATRGTDPKRWYGPGPAFDDMPEKDRVNVNTSRVPYDRGVGEAPRLDDGEIDAIVAFLQTLTDAEYR